MTALGKCWGLSCRVAVLACFLATTTVAASDSKEGVKQVGKDPDQGAVVVIYDSSASMWGPVGPSRHGPRKFEVARTVLTELVDDLGLQNLDLSIGLVAYGHRAKGQCTDIETLVDPNRINLPAHRKSMKQAIEELIPKGTTPIADSLEFAAEALKYAERRATVVLISDGLEECQGDPCAVASRLERLGVDFTAHVIGFDLEQEQLDALRCIADRTGGELHPAEDSAALHEALRKLADRIRKRQQLAYVTFEISTGVEAPTATAVLAAAKVELLAVDQPDLEARQFEVGGATPHASVVPGRYRAVLHAMGVTKSKTFEARPQEHNQVVFALGPGRVDLSAVDEVSRETYPSDWVSWTIESETAGLAPEKHSGRNPTVLSLQGGNYVAWANVLGSTAKTSFAVTPETENSIELPIGSGRLTILSGLVAPELFPEAPVSSIALELLRDDRAISRSDGNLIERVPIGDYRVIGRYRGLSKTAGPFSVVKDDDLEIEILFGAGRLAGQGLNDQGQLLGSGDAEWRIKPLDSQIEIETARLRGSHVNPTLPPGRYEVVLDLHGSSDRAEVTIKPEETTHVELKVHEPQ